MSADYAGRDGYKAEAEAGGGGVSLEIKQYLAYAHLPIFRRRVEKAKLLIEDMFARCNIPPYVAFSMGKDSAVALHLVAQVCPNVEARTLCFPETRILYREWDSLRESWAAQLPDVLFSEFLAEPFPDAAPDWFSQLRSPLGNSARLLLGNSDGVFLGLRSMESNARRMAARRGGPIRFVKRMVSTGQWVCCPIQDWSITDVGAYIYHYRLPLLDEYKAHGLSMRTTAGLSMMGLQKGLLHNLRVRDPEAYNMLIARWPEIVALGGGGG